ncbi:MAG: glycosyltransferase [Bacteroidota bacterium]
MQAPVGSKNRIDPRLLPQTRMPSIIYPPTIDWHYLYQRPQQLMTALAKLGYRVFFCNAEVGRKPRPGIARLAANLYLVSGGDPGPAAGNAPILWISYPPHVHVLSRYGPGLVVFDAVDEPAEEFAHWAASVALLRERADVIFASSISLYESHSRLHPNVHLCPNAADYAHFARGAGDGTIPGDLAAIPRPVIGYHGALANWLDWELIEATAAANQDLSFVFIGPLFTGGEHLPSGANLHYLGHRDYRLLPNYLRGFDAAIIPFRVSPMTKGCNPIKLWEYLAAGKPVVSTPLPEVRQFAEIRVADTPAEFGAALRKALAAAGDAGAIAARQALARGNSWEARALQIHRVLVSAKQRSARP